MSSEVKQRWTLNDLTPVVSTHKKCEKCVPSLKRVSIITELANKQRRACGYTWLRFINLKVTQF